MDTSESANLPHVVVLGAGFGGLSFCNDFDSSLARITLVDRQNHHLFQPLLYQVATAGLAAPDIAQPIRSILAKKPNLSVVMDEVASVDLAANQVTLAQAGTLRYDYLVLALGGVTSYFGHPEWEAFAPGLKSLDDALRIRRQILLSYERAETEKDESRRQALMTSVVVGGGPTGVELAGAFAELARHVLKRDFEHIDPTKARVLLVEAAPRVLGHLPHDLSASAERQLRRLGVEVRTGAMVKDIREGVVELPGETIEAANIVWAAGVSASPLSKQLGVELDRAGRVKVLPDLSVPARPQVFVIGDMATIADKEGKPVPAVSPAAMQMASHVAKLIGGELRGMKRQPAAREAFAYWDKGTMATIGRSAAVAMVGKIKFSGFLAWLAWLVVHLAFLVGFRNKVTVFIQWVWSYLTFKRGARLITGVSSPAERRAAG